MVTSGNNILDILTRPTTLSIATPDTKLPSKKPARRRKKKRRPMSEYRPPSPFSPKPDYKSMELDQIKKHAMQYGLSVGLAKGRLIKILDEIYHVTHQYETDSDFEWEARGTDAPKEPLHRKNPPHTPPTPAIIPEAKKVKKRPPIHQMSSSDEADEPIATPPTTQKPTFIPTADPPEEEEDNDDDDDANHEGRFLELTVYELSSSTASSHSASISGTPPTRPADGHQSDSKSKISRRLIFTPRGSLIELAFRITRFSCFQSNDFKTQAQISKQTVHIYLRF